MGLSGQACAFSGSVVEGLRSRISHIGRATAWHANCTYPLFQSTDRCDFTGRPDMKDRIYITEVDFEKLRRLVEGRRSGTGADARYLHILEQDSIAPTWSSRMRSPGTS